MPSSSQRPLISIIVPTYNRAEALRLTLRSLLGQTYTNLEVIVVSDAGADHTPAVVASFQDQRLRFIRLEQNLGAPAGVRNRGMREAKGDYIAYCDDDDLWVPEKLERQLPFLEGDGSLLAVASNMVYFPGIYRLGYPMLRHRRLDYDWQLHHYNHICNSSVLMRREVVDYIGYQDTDPGLRAVEDFDYWLRILQYRDDSILVLRQPLVKYRIHPANISLLEDSRRQRTMQDKIRTVLEKHLPPGDPYLRELREERDAIVDRTFYKRHWYNHQLSLRALLSADGLSWGSKLEFLVKKPLLIAFFLLMNWKNVRALAN